MVLRITAEDSLFLIIDIQEKLAPAINGGEDVISTTHKLLQAAIELGVPYLVSEQYPKGIGKTVPILSELISPDCILEKMTFSCLREAEVKKAIEDTVLKQIVVCGTETHVCVLQTVLDLIADGYQVFVIEDAVGSRTVENKILGLDRMRHCGAQIVSSEMVMFEWLGRAGTDSFKKLLPLIK